MTDRELCLRGCATAVASWEEYARGSPDATVRRLPGVDAAVFPRDPERAVYNNAVLGLGARSDTVDAMEAAYADGGVERYAAWVHESDDGMIGELESRGYSLAETTRAMGMRLDGELPAPPPVELEPIGWREYLDYLWSMGVPEGLLEAVDGTAFQVLAARRSGEVAATAIAYDHDGDCGVFNMSTRESARRRGLGTALTARHVLDAAARGCSTATLQATPMAERVYGSVGFRDLGRILEFAPGLARGRGPK